MAKRTKALPLHRCKAQNKRGEPCSATIVGLGGYCVAHDPERKVDMRELGRKGGKGRKAIDPERVHPNLRQFLRENVEPAEVWAALKLAMTGANESARVSASKVLLDALAEPEQDKDERRKADRQRANAQAKQRVAELLAARARAGQPRQIRDLLEKVAEVLEAEAVDEHPDLIVGDVSPAQARRVLEGMHEAGLIIVPWLPGLKAVK